MTDHPISQRFDDIYFSRQDGLAETRHVFLDRNDLPERWMGKKRFTIAETGFGTGLNFLAAWTLFDETSAPDAVLDYISFELYPLSSADIAKALHHWRGFFGDRLDRMVASYPLRIPGWHRVDFTTNGIVRVRLTLVFDDVNTALPRLTAPCGVDAWFLDGFAPAKNPEMWTETVFNNMARLSRQGTTLSSFTAAGVVKNGLREAGFEISKARGFGHKRDMVTGVFAGVFAGVFEGQGQTGEFRHSGPVAIIGGGLAGTACAAMLRQRGIDHVVFEQGPMLAHGASGNSRGIFNPRFMAHRNAQSDFYSAAYALAVRLLMGSKTACPANQPCGSLHLFTDAEREKRLRGCLENWGWHDDHMRVLDPEAASAQAGITLAHGGLYLPDSGQVSPRALCHEWADGSDIRLNRTISADDLDGYGAIILACGAGVTNFFPDLPLETIRGQVIEAAATTQSRSLRSNLCYGGYIGPEYDGTHMIGASFQRWLSDTAPREEDTRDILGKMHGMAPVLEVGEVLSARASLRCAAKDRFPVIGRVGDNPRFLVTTAHGSHGMISALAGAHLLADMIDGSPYSLPQDSILALSPQRFRDRLQRKGRI